jgi:hypothetical protein
MKPPPKPRVRRRVPLEDESYFNTLSALETEANIILCETLKIKHFNLWNL